jgi:hypothetical protein
MPSPDPKNAGLFNLEKAVLVRSLIAAEAEEEDSEQTARIAELESSQKLDAAKIADLEQQNRRLASTPARVEHIADPEAARVRAERDDLLIVVKGALAFLADAKDVKEIDFNWITTLLRCDEVSLIRFEDVHDLTARAVVKAVRRAKFGRSEPESKVVPKVPLTPPARPESADIIDRVNSWNHTRSI